MNVVYVTGGASGIGLGISRFLLAHKFKLFIMDMNSENGQKVKNELASEFGEDNVDFAAGDITNEIEACKAITQCINTFGRIDVLINNAGIGILEKTFDEKTQKPHDINRFRLVIDVNVIGTFNMSRLVAEQMFKNDPDLDNQRGLIINISSTSGMESTAGQVAYSASKAAINGMTLIMARDLENIGIRVMTICPGAFETPALKHFIDTHPDYKLPALFPKRCGKVEEIGNIIKTIIDCKILNGAFWRVDSGERCLKTTTAKDKTWLNFLSLTKQKTNMLINKPWIYSVLLLGFFFNTNALIEFSFALQKNYNLSLLKKRFFRTKIDCLLS